MSFTLGVDIGTFESKGVLVDAAGLIVARASRPHEMVVPRAGWAEHRPMEDWWGDFVGIARALVAGIDPSEIAAVAVSAIGPCMLPVDEGGAPLMNGVLYGVDSRASAEVAELRDRIGADRVLARGGNPLTSQSVGPKILWLKRNRPDLFDRTARVLTSSSFVVQQLTGEQVIDHYTAANFTPLYDIAAQDWCFDLADDIVGREKLPRLLWSSEIAGRVTEAAARETGLAEGTPVTAGTIDAAAEALSVGVRRPGDLMVMYGSTIFVIALTEAPVTDGRLYYAPWLFPGQHATMAGQSTSGTLTHWFRDQMARELSREEAFGALAAEAAAVPAGAEGLLFLPYFSGALTPLHDPKARGAFFGLNLTHSRGHLFRAVLEGIAHSTAQVLDTFAEAGARPERIFAVGGGTRNPVWLQATSDITGLDQTLRETSAGASYGDALLARIAVGECGADRIETWNPVADRVGAERRAVYDAAHPLFRRLYEQTRDIAAALPG